MLSPFFTGNTGRSAGSRGFGANFSALAKAFIPDPLETAGILEAQNAADYYGARTAEIGQRRAGFNTMADRIRQGGISPDVFRGILAGAAQTGDVSALGQAGSILRAYGFSQPGTTQLQRDGLYMGAGGLARDTESGFQLENTRRRPW